MILVVGWFFFDPPDVGGRAPRVILFNVGHPQEFFHHDLNSVGFVEVGLEVSVDLVKVTEGTLFILQDSENFVCVLPSDKMVNIMLQANHEDHKP